METKEAIFFYKESVNHGYMSNFYKSKFVDENGITFNCSEQFFMYHKAITFDKKSNIPSLILKETSPFKVKQYGRKVKNFNEDIWNDIGYDIMKAGSLLKFSQNEDILEKLLLTNDKILYEASKWDKKWGIGMCAKNAINKDKTTYGLNLLGKCLMEVREELK